MGYCRLLESTGRVLGGDWVVLGVTGGALGGASEGHWALLGRPWEVIGWHWELLGGTRSHWVVIGWHWVLPGDPGRGSRDTGYYWNVTGRHWVTFAPRQVLLPTAAFTSPSESRAGAGPGLRRVRMFGPETLVKGVAGRGWDRLRLVCSQPYCQVTGRGLGGAGGA